MGVLAGVALAHCLTWAREVARRRSGAKALALALAVELHHFLRVWIEEVKGERRGITRYLWASQGVYFRVFEGNVESLRLLPRNVQQRIVECYADLRVALDDMRIGASRQIDAERASTFDKPDVAKSIREEADAFIDAGRERGNCAAPCAEELMCELSRLGHITLPAIDMKQVRHDAPVCQKHAGDG